MGVTSHKVGATAASVLASTQVTCMLPVKDMARALRFYEEALGRRRFPLIPFLALSLEFQGMP